VDQSNLALGIALLMALAAIIGFAAGYGLRSYISHRRRQKFGWYRRPKDFGGGSNP